MRKLITLLLAAMFTQVAVAQVAVKGGLNFANMVFEDDEDDIQDLAKNGNAGLTGGLAFIIPFGDVIALQPEILYTQKGSELNYTILGEDYYEKVRYNYIDIPILLRLSLGGTYGEGLGLYLNGGVYAGYALNGKKEQNVPILGMQESDISFDDQDREGRVDFGAVGGVGLSLGDLFLELRYMHGINNLLDNDADNSNDVGFNKLQHRGLGLTAGWVF